MIVAGDARGVVAVVEDVQGVLLSLRWCAGFAFAPPVNRGARSDGALLESGPDETRLVGEDHCLDAVAEV